MSRSLLAALLFAVCASTAQAQALLPAEPDSARVLPVVSQNDGRIEALLLIDDEPSIGAHPLSELLGVPHPGVAFDLRRMTREDPRFGATLRLEAPAGLALLCDRNAGLSMSFGALAERCMLARLGDNEFGLDAFGRGASLEGRWREGSGAFDLSFGLSWLEAPLGDALLDTAVATATATNSLLPQIVLNDPTSTIEQLLLSVQGTRQFGSRGWMRVEAQHGRNRLHTTFDPLMPLRVDSSALSLGGGYGRFSGVVTGRRFELPSERSSWIDFDLGLSWRTPWSGKLTIGAENLLGTPQRETWPLTQSETDHDADTRTPYVRYQQDL